MAGRHHPLSAVKRPHPEWLDLSAARASSSRRRTASMPRLRRGWFTGGRLQDGRDQVWLFVVSLVAGASVREEQRAGCRAAPERGRGSPQEQQRPAGVRSTAALGRGVGVEAPKDASRGSAAAPRRREQLRARKRSAVGRRAVAPPAGPPSRGGRCCPSTSRLLDALDGLDRAREMQHPVEAYRR